MTLDKVAGLEDVEAGQGKEAKHLYDPHTWLDPVKSQRKERSSPNAWDRLIQNKSRRATLKNLKVL